MSLTAQEFAELDPSLVQAIADQYTAYAPVDEICIEYDLTRRDLDRIRRKHGLRRGVPRILVEGESEEADVEHHARVVREASVERRMRARVKRELERDARRWRQFEDAVREAEQAAEGWWKDYHVPSIALVPQLPLSALVVNAQDVHVGKRTVDGTDNVEAAKQAFSRALDRARRQALFEVAYVTIGADFFHVDSLDATTTKGTPQDLALSVPEMLLEGQQLLVWMIDQLRQLRGPGGPTRVELVAAAGNHDRAFSTWLYTWAQAWYRGCAQVVSRQGAEAFLPRQYREYGKTLMLFAHGDGVKARDLGKVIAQEAREAWGRTQHAVAFTGHYHHEAVREDAGLAVYQTPSSSGADAWHFEKGHTTSRRGIQMHVIDADEGVVATLTGCS